MIYTFQINTTESRNLKVQIENYLTSNNLSLPKEHIEKLSYYIHNKSYMFVDSVKANSEESAWDKVNIENISEKMEITDIDDSDEIEAEEQARDRYESQLEDEAMERARGII